MANPFWLQLQAPFAAFRWLQAGVFRASSPTMPPSAAWGLVLNLAGVETRGSLSSVVTKRREDAPAFEVAIGDLRLAETNSLYQQLHGYPVGNSGKELEKLAHGSKYWIAPARREVLTDVELLIGVRGEDETLECLVRAGLSGNGKRYGLPFLGDNNFLIDRVDVLPNPIPAYWYCRLQDGEHEDVRGTCRLTVDINRSDSAKTKSDLYQRTSELHADPPEPAWTRVPG